MQELDLARGQGLLASSRGDGVNEGEKREAPESTRAPFHQCCLMLGGASLQQDLGCTVGIPWAAKATGTSDHEIPVGVVKRHPCCSHAACTDRLSSHTCFLSFDTFVSGRWPHKFQFMKLMRTPAKGNQ